MRPHEANLAHLLGHSPRPDLKPSEIQFELARRIIEEEQLAPDSHVDGTQFSLSYRFSAA